MTLCRQAIHKTATESWRHCIWARVHSSLQEPACTSTELQVFNGATLTRATAARSWRGTACLHTQQQPPPQQRLSAPVLISGAGPSGLTLALLLSRFGVPSLILEQSQALTTHPQAHYINNRTMEVFRTIDSSDHSSRSSGSSGGSSGGGNSSRGLASEVVACTPPLDEWRKFIYCNSMLGDVLGDVDHFKGQSSPHVSAISPEPVAHLPQHRLLPLMLARTCARSSLARVLFGHTVQQAVLPEEGGVALTVQDARGQCILVEGSFLVAGDGAHSRIRQQLGIPLAGHAAMQHLINIHFTSRTLGQALLSNNGGSLSPHRGGGSSILHAQAGPQGVGHKQPQKQAQTHPAGQLQPSGQPQQPAIGPRAAMLYFVFNRSVVAVVVAHDLQRGEFVAQVPYFPPIQSPKRDFSASACAEIVRAASGLPSDQLHDLQVLQARPWVMSSLVAERYMHPHTGVKTCIQTQNPPGSQINDSSSSSSSSSRSRSKLHNSDVPRIFLVGDAAHSFPPAGGFGMNTGVQDAHNLAWKLAMVIHSKSGTRRQQQQGQEQQVHQGEQIYLNSSLCPAHLLSSYEAERQPVAHANAALSESNWREAVRVPSILGLDPRAANLLNSVVGKVPAPSALKRHLLEAGLSLGKVATTEWAPAPLRAWQKAQLQRVFASGETLRLQFPREDLGFVYHKGAVAGSIHGAGQPSNTHQQQLDGGRVLGSAELLAPSGRGSPYVPCSAPGCRMPHFWLLDTVSFSQAAPVTPLSTLDVAAGPLDCAPSFVLFVYGEAGGLGGGAQGGGGGGGGGEEEEGGGMLGSRAQDPGLRDAHSSSPWVYAAAAVNQAYSAHHPSAIVRVLHIVPGEVGRGGNKKAGVAAARHATKLPARGSSPTAGAGGGDGSSRLLGTHAVAVDVDGCWPAIMCLPWGSAVLVRPDGHIAWRYVAGPAADDDDAGNGGGGGNDDDGDGDDDDVAVAASVAAAAPATHASGAARAALALHAHSPGAFMGAHLSCGTMPGTTHGTMHGVHMGRGGGGCGTAAGAASSPASGSHNSLGVTSVSGGSSVGATGGGSSEDGAEGVIGWGGRARPGLHALTGSTAAGLLWGALRTVVCGASKGSQ